MQRKWEEENTVTKRLLIIVRVFLNILCSFQASHLEWHQRMEMPSAYRADKRKLSSSRCYFQQNFILMTQYCQTCAQKDFKY